MEGKDTKIPKKQGSQGRGSEQHLRGLGFTSSSIDSGYGSIGSRGAASPRYPTHERWMTTSKEPKLSLKDRVDALRPQIGKIEKRPNDSDSALLAMSASIGDEVAVTSLLERHDLDIDRRDEHGQTPLYYAAGNGHAAIVKLLLQTGRVNANARDIKYGRTPLFYAARGGHEAVVKLLLVVNVDPNEKDDKHGRSPLSYAAGNGHERVVKLLLDTGYIDANTRDKYGQTPLYYAARNGHQTTVKLLLETGKIDANITDNTYGWTPLSYTAGNGYEAIVKLLLEIGKADANTKDTKYGRTPLSYAAGNGHEAVVKLLLNLGNVDTNAKDTKYGRTPLSYAAGNGHDVIVRQLLETGNVDINTRDMYDRTSLSYAAGNGHDVIVRQLLETGNIDINKRDMYGHTPLSYAAGSGHETVVQIILGIGKIDDDDTRDMYNPTPPSYDAGNKHEVLDQQLSKTGKSDAAAKDNRPREESNNEHHPEPNPEFPNSGGWHNEGDNEDAESSNSETFEPTDSSTSRSLASDQSIMSYTLEAQKMRAVENLMQIVYALLDQATGFQNHGSSSGPTYPSTSPDQSNSQQQQRQLARRKGKGKETADGESDPENDENMEQLSGSIYKSSSGNLGKRLACPFYRHKPHEHQQHRSCAGPGWHEVHRIKEHIYRRHEQPIHCHRCVTIFDTESDLRQHQRSLQECKLRCVDLPGGCTAEQKNLLKKRKKQAIMSEVQKWREMFKILFPNIKEDAIPTPYYDNDLATERERYRAEDLDRYDQYLRQELPLLVRRRLESAVSQLTMSFENQLRDQLVEIIRECQTELARSYRQPDSIVNGPILTSIHGSVADQNQLDSAALQLLYPVLRDPPPLRSPSPTVGGDDFLSPLYGNLERAQVAASDSAYQSMELPILRSSVEITSHADNYLQLNPEGTDMPWLGELDMACLEGLDMGRNMDKSTQVTENED